MTDIKERIDYIERLIVGVRNVVEKEKVMVDDTLCRPYKFVDADVLCDVVEEILPELTCSQRECYQRGFKAGKDKANDKINRLCEALLSSSENCDDEIECIEYRKLVSEMQGEDNV